MSRRHNETRSKIACAIGAIIVIKDNDLASESVKGKLRMAIAKGGLALQKIQGAGDIYKNDNWCIKAVHSIDQDIDALGIYTFKTLIWFAHLITLGLMEDLPNKYKIIVKPFYDEVSEIGQEVTEGYMDIFYDKANILIDKLNKNMERL